MEKLLCFQHASALRIHARSTQPPTCAAKLVSTDAVLMEKSAISPALTLGAMEVAQWNAAIQIAKSATVEQPAIASIVVEVEDTILTQMASAAIHSAPHALEQANLTA